MSHIPRFLTVPSLLVICFTIFFSTSSAARILDYDHQREVQQNQAWFPDPNSPYDMIIDMYDVYIVDSTIFSIYYYIKNLGTETIDLDLVYVSFALSNDVSFDIAEDTVIFDYDVYGTLSPGQTRFFFVSLQQPYPMCDNPFLLGFVDSDDVVDEPDEVNNLDIMIANPDLDCGCDYIVTSTSQFGPGSITEAIACSNPGGSILFSPVLNGDTIVFTQDSIIIDKDLNIIAAVTSDLHFDASLLENLFHIEPGVELNLEGIYILSPASPSANVIWNDGSAILHDVTIFEADGSATGFSMGGSGELLMAGGTFILPD